MIGLLVRSLVVQVEPVQKLEPKSKPLVMVRVVLVHFNLQKAVQILRLVPLIVLGMNGVVGVNVLRLVGTLQDPELEVKTMRQTEESLVKDLRLRMLFVN